MQKLNEKHKKFLKFYVANMGNVKQTCEAMNMSRQTYYKWFNTNDTFKMEAEAVFEGLLDTAESQLHMNIMEGKEASIFFFLKTRGKARGYIERVEQEIKATVDVKGYDEFFTAP